jgi:hypothetical protein
MVHEKNGMGSILRFYSPKLTGNGFKGFLPVDGFKSPAATFSDPFQRLGEAIGSG